MGAGVPPTHDRRGSQARPTAGGLAPSPRSVGRLPAGPTQILNTSTPVVVLKFNHGALGIARSLGRLGIAVYGVHANLDAPAMRSRHLRGRLAWDVERSPASDTVDLLLQLGRRLGRSAILIPISDRTALFVDDNAEALRERFLFPRLPPQLAATLISKQASHFLARSVGVSVPTAVFPRNREGVLRFLETAAFPVVLKGVDGSRLAEQHGLRLVIANGPGELLEHYDALEEPQQPNLMLQEYVPGGEDGTWMFNGYFDRNSECLFGLCGRKLRQTPAYAGSASLAVCLRNDTVESIALRFLKAVRYQGIVDVDFRFDARDGSYKLLDVNPRIGSTFRLFVSGSGMDVARALYLDLTGQPVVADAPVYERKWIIEDWDLESFLRYRRDGRLKLGQWLGSLRGVRETAWFALDDLAPGLAILAESLARLLRWLGRRLLGRRANRPPADELAAEPGRSGRAGS